MSLHPKEIQLLALVAKNRHDPKAQELFKEFEVHLSSAARALGKKILSTKVAAKKTGSESTADVFIRLADARNQARQNRSLVVAG